MKLITLLNNMYLVVNTYKTVSVCQGKDVKTRVDVTRKPW